VKVRLHQGFQVHFGHHLGYPVSHRGNTQDSGSHHYLSESPLSAPAVESNSPRTSGSRACRGSSSDPGQTPQWTPRLPQQHLGWPLPSYRPPDHLLGNTKRLCFTQRLLPYLVDHQVKPIDTTPSLHPHYGTSSLIRVVPPLCPASVLSPSWVFHLSFSLDIGTTGSHVPPESLDQGHATFMPDAAQAVGRLPLGLSWSQASLQFRRHLSVSTPHQWFACARLPDPHLPRSCAATCP
jgi:hypothetical protein